MLCNASGGMQQSDDPKRANLGEGSCIGIPSSINTKRIESPHTQLPATLGIAGGDQHVNESSRFHRRFVPSQFSSLVDRMFRASINFLNHTPVRIGGIRVTDIIDRHQRFENKHHSLQRVGYVTVSSSESGRIG